MNKKELHKYILKYYFKGDELATKVFLNKYSNNRQETPDDLHKRLAKEFAKIEYNYNQIVLSSSNIEKLSKYGQDRYYILKNNNKLEYITDNFFNLFKNFKYLSLAGSGMANIGLNTPTSLSNCFVLPSPEDNIESIFNTARDVAQIFKRRGGVGFDNSKLRPMGSEVNNSAKTTTGPVSFMTLYSEVTKVIGQQGRRGAMMISIDVNHPDVADFADSKVDLTKITGANISIKLNDEFLEAVKVDGDYILKYPCDHTFSPLISFEEKEYNKLYKIKDGTKLIYYKIIKAKELWDKIINNAWLTAEPGIFNWDELLNYDPTSVYPELKAISTNPCGELPLGAYDSCRLLSTNLYSLVKDPFTSKAVLDTQLAYKIFYEAQVLADNLVDLEIEAVDNILKKIQPFYLSNSFTKKYITEEWIDKQSDEFKLWWKIREIGEKGRRTGTGITAYADMLAALGKNYGDSEITEKVFKLKLEAELDATIDMAISRGSFPLWDVKKEYGAIQAEECSNNYHRVAKNNWYKFIRDNYTNQFKKMCRYGRRNAGISTIAPTGSLSIMTQTSSGIEPVFMPIYIRKVTCQSGEKPDIIEQGIGYKKIATVHPKLIEWYKIVGYEVFEGDLEKGLSKVPSVEELTSNDWNYLYQFSPYYKQSSADINYKIRVNTQSLIQKYITSSISSTVNLPSDINKETVGNIYLESFEKRCKGITVYRDGSRGGILITEESYNNFKQYNAPKRPKELKSELHISKIEGKCYCIVVGLLEDKPYEVFVVKVDSETYSKYQKELAHYNNKCVSGFTIKKGKGHYSFSSSIINIHKLVEGDNVTEKLCTLYTSMLLRQGASIHYVIKTAKKIDSNINSFVTVMCRVLNTYNDKKETLVCDKCGGTVIKEAGCSKCLDCGDSICG